MSNAGKPIFADTYLYILVIFVSQTVKRLSVLRFGRCFKSRDENRNLTMCLFFKTNTCISWLRIRFFLVLCVSLQSVTIKFGSPRRLNTYY